MLLNEKISILLSTYNGEKYLKNQLESLLIQACKNINVIVRDDGSVSDTLRILSSYNVDLLESQSNVGPKKSFSLLLEYTLQNSDSDYFMFSDQDDVWKEDKVEKTFKKMQEMEKKYLNLPILVHTDLEVVSESLNIIDESFWHFENLDPSINQFSRLLLQNTVTGCTVMINRKLAELALPMPEDAIMHDWWLALVTSKFGKIAYLDEQTIKYRQHDKNSIGAKGFSYIFILMKFYKLFYKKELYLKHMHANLLQAKAFLEMYRKNLNGDTIQMLEEFTALESKSFWQKRKILLKHKLLKQGFIRNVGLLTKI